MEDDADFYGDCASKHREIHNYDAYELGPKDFDMYEYNDYKIVYHRESKKDDESRCYHQLDELRIYKNNELIITHKPHLDPYVSWDQRVICMSSDGELWIYDLEHNKELLFEQGIVAFYQSVYIDEARYDVKDNVRIPVSENRIFVYGDGCVWGCEADEIHFTLELDYDLNVIDYNEEWEDDEYNDNEDEEEDEEES